MNSIKTENTHIGTEEWKLTNPAIFREVEGYASATSIEAGESLQLFVSSKSKTINYAIYRMGWYQGLGARCYLKPQTSNVKLQQITAADKETGLIECDWKNPITIQTTKKWTQGVYVAKLEETEHGKQSYIIFVIKNQDIKSDILFQLPVTTYQAYNYWGGKSLYDWGSGSEKYWGHQYGIRASMVSFNRPYAASNNPKAAYGVGAGEFFTNLQPVNTQYYPVSSAAWDYNMVRWLEKNEYNVNYITSLDTHYNPEILNNTKVFLSHGHDEYWSAEMRKNIEELENYDVNLAFFSANTMFWQIRIEKRSKNDIIICYKDVEKDPIKSELCTVNFRDLPVDNSESKIIGVQHFVDPVNGDLVISHAEHDVFQGTGLKNGDILEGLLGYEVDKCDSNSPKNIKKLTASPTKNLLKDNYIALGLMLWHKLFIKLVHKLPIIPINYLLLFKTIVTIILLISIILLFLISLFYAPALLKFLIIFFLAAIFFIGVFLYKKMKDLKEELLTDNLSNMTIYETTNNTKVFSTGTIQWSWGLDNFNTPVLRKSLKNKKVELITKNIFKILTKD